MKTAPHPFDDLEGAGDFARRVLASMRSKISSGGEKSRASGRHGWCRGAAFFAALIAVIFVGSCAASTWQIVNAVAPAKQGGAK
jgi:hypothetical protein